MVNDELCVVHPRAAEFDVRKAHITAAVRLLEATVGKTHVFSALASGLAALAAWLTSHRVVAEAIEATGIYWHTPWPGFTAAGIEAQLLHPQHVKQLRGRKTDVEDSRWLARVCQFGRGRPSFVPSQQFRDLRTLSRHRRKLVARRIQMQKVIDRVGAALTDIFGISGRRILDGLVARLASPDILASLSSHVRRKLDQLGDALSLALWETERCLLAEHDTLRRRMHDFDRHIDRTLAAQAEQRHLLETLPGIDRTGAGAVLAEIGPDIAVFGNAHRLAAWAGLCPGNNESAGKRRSGRTRRANQTLRAVLIGCAHAAARTNHCQFQAYHQALTRHRGYKCAIVDTDRKLLRCLFAVLRDGTPYPRPGHRLRGDPRPPQRPALAAQAAAVQRFLPQRGRHPLAVLATSSEQGHRPDALTQTPALTSAAPFSARGHLGQPHQSNLTSVQCFYRGNLS